MTDRNASSDIVTTNVDQPYLVLTKDNMPPAGPYKGGDSVNYRTRVDKDRKSVV